MSQSVATKKPTGWGAGGRVVLLMVEVARVEVTTEASAWSIARRQIQIAVGPAVDASLTYSR